MKLAFGMLTDIRINPDNKLSGYIRIINYPFNYPSTWRLIIFMCFLCSFRNFYAVLQKTRSQAVARIADRTAKNSMGHVT